jgi:hypothetical protein
MKVNPIEEFIDHTVYEIKRCLEGNESNEKEGMGDVILMSGAVEKIYFHTPF